VWPEKDSGPQFAVRGPQPLFITQEIEAAAVQYGTATLREGCWRAAWQAQNVAPDRAGTPTGSDMILTASIIIISIIVPGAYSLRCRIAGEG
jgi:hypothetical protein